MGYRIRFPYEIKQIAECISERSAKWVKVTFWNSQQENIDELFFAQLDSLEQNTEVLQLSVEEEVVINLCLAKLLLKQDRINDAFPYFREAVDISTRLSDQNPVKAYAEASFGGYMFHHQLYDLSLEPLKNSLTGLKSCDPEKPFVSGGVYEYLVRTYIKLNEIDSAQVYHRLQLNAFQELGDIYSFANACNNTGLYLQEVDQDELAIREFLRGRAAIENSNHEFLFTYVNIGESMSHSLIKAGRFAEGVQLLEEAYWARKEMKDRYGAAMQALNYILTYQMEAGNVERALQIFRERESYFDFGREVSWRTYHLYGTLAELMRRNGRVVEASRYENAYNRYVTEKLYAKVADRDRRNLDRFVELQRRNYEQDAEVRRFQNESLAQQLRIVQLRWNIGFGVLLIMLISGLIFLGYRREKRKQRTLDERQKKRLLRLENEKLQYQLETKQRDLQRIAADNRVRTQTRQDIMERLQTALRGPEKNRVRKLEQLYNYLEITVDDQNKVSELQDKVEIINSAFEEALKRAVPNLTSQEIFVCGLIRTGMNNQQIAQLMNKSDSTVRSYKFRIRKKAGINKPEGLEEFVKNVTAGSNLN